ncbi:hypothetical protein ACFL6H_01465 [Candidatus Latescibacterota bacterium]
MKRIIILTVLLITTPLNVHAEKPFRRAGITFGGTALLSLSYERHFSDKSLRFNVGTTEGDISLSFSVNRYFSKSRRKFFAGAGNWTNVVPYKGIEYITLLHAPVGVDWQMSDKKYLGFEMDMNLFITGRHHDGSKVEFNSPIFHKNFILMPAIYYKIELHD